MRSVRWRMAWVPLVLLACGGSLCAQESRWERSCRFAVEVDGVAGSAGAVFERRGVPDLMGQMNDGAWFLLQPDRRQSLPLPARTVRVEDGGRVAVLAGALPTSGSPVRLTPAALTFELDGRWIRVLPTPPLLGDVSADDFLNLCPDFQDRAHAYQPNSDMVQKIASADGELTVEVFFGSWCPHCQQILPRLIKSLEQAGNQRLTVQWIGLPRAFMKEPRAQAREIRGVPTIIVLDGERELGRFSGNEAVPIEELLAKLVVQG